MRGRNYRTSRGQAYTREKFIHGIPPPKISRFTTGDLKVHFPYKVSLVSQAKVQVRHNAIESARISANKVMFDKLGETGYRIHVRVYPHIILRENRMIATAGADRLQEGMRRSFGKPSGRAVRIRNNQALLDVYVNEGHVETAKEALRISASKLPQACRVEVQKLEEAPAATAQAAQ